MDISQFGRAPSWLPGLTCFANFSMFSKRAFLEGFRVMRRGGSLAISVYCLSTACHATPSERLFTDEMLRRIQAVHPQLNMRIKRDEPLVLERGRPGDKDEDVINLHRVYQYCLTAPQTDCEASRQEFVSKVGIRPPPPEAGKLRVIVRHEEYAANVRQMLGPAGEFVEPRRIGDDLYAMLAFDAQETIAVANAEMLRNLKLTPDAAWSLAMRQTKAVLPALPDGKTLSRAATAYEGQEYLGSLLADLDGWRRVAADAGPEMIVTVVSDQFVFVGIMPDGARLNAFQQTVAEDCRQQQRCTSSHIYRFRSGRWSIAR